MSLGAAPAADHEVRRAATTATIGSYFLLALIGMTAESIEHVISYWVIFESFHSPTLGGFAVISHWVPYLLSSPCTRAPSPIASTAAGSSRSPRDC